MLRMTRMSYDRLYTLAFAFDIPKYDCLAYTCTFLVDDCHYVACVLCFRGRVYWIGSSWASPPRVNTFNRLHQVFSCVWHTLIRFHSFRKKACVGVSRPYILMKAASCCEPREVILLEAFTLLPQEQSPSHFISCGQLLLRRQNLEPSMKVIV